MSPMHKPLIRVTDQTGDTTLHEVVQHVPRGGLSAGYTTFNHGGKAFSVCPGLPDPGDPGTRERNIDGMVVELVHRFNPGDPVAVKEHSTGTLCAGYTVRSVQGNGATVHVASDNNRWRRVFRYNSGRGAWEDAHQRQRTRFHKPQTVHALTEDVTRRLVHVGAVQRAQALLAVLQAQVKCLDGSTLTSNALSEYLTDVRETLGQLEEVRNDLA